MTAPDLLRRLERYTVWVVGVLALGALWYRPSDPRVALGVVGGGALVGVSYWAIRGVVDLLQGAAGAGERPRKVRAAVLVKFFTRHGILAVAAYVMLARLRLHPVGMLLGVTAPAIAVALEAAAGRRSRRP